MSKSSLDHLLDDWESFVVDSELGFWAAVEDVREVVGHAESQEDVRRYTLDLLEELLRQRVIVAAQLNEEATGPPFHEWTGDVTSQISRMDFEWRRLGRWPDMLEICWFLDGPNHPQAEELKRQREKREKELGIKLS